MKNTRTRKAKGLPRYKKAKIVEKHSRSVIQIQLNKKKDYSGNKNVKRPLQVVHRDMAGPSWTRQHPISKTGPESGNSSDTDRYSSDED